MLKDVSFKEHSIRESLAKKQTELDKREKSLARRELLISSDEENLKNDVDLLKL